MPAPQNNFSSEDETFDPIALAASQWLARRDRGLTADEQDHYLQWLAENPQHGRAIARLERAWGSLNSLAQWRPAHSARPNPDLLATRPAPPRRRGVAQRAGWALVALAAALAVGVFLWPRAPGGASHPVAVAPAVRVLPAAERIALPDGSLIELSTGGRIETAYTAGERRVRLLRGEAQFTVAKNPARPFVVEAGTIAVRALGTVFDVRRNPGLVEVLVSEGKVQVEGGGEVPVPVGAGQRATIAGALAADVSAVSAAEIDRALAWRAVRLDFVDVPLREVVTEFNLRAPAPLLLGDQRVGELRVGGTFRADNVDAFVRLLEASFGVAVETRADGARILRVK